MKLCALCSELRCLWVTQQADGFVLFVTFGKNKSANRLRRGQLVLVGIPAIQQRMEHLATDSVCGLQCRDVG